MAYQTPISRAGYQNVIGVGIQTSNISAAVNITGTACAFGNGKGGLLVNNDVVFSDFRNQEEQDKYHGEAARFGGDGGEIQQTTYGVNTTLEFDASASTLAPFLWTIFQKGSIESDDAPYVKGFSLYQDAGCQAWLTIVKKLYGRDSTYGAVSHRIYGAIATSLNISGSEGEVMKASASIQGAGLSTDANNVPNRDASSDTFVSDGVNPFHFSDANFLIYDSSDHKWMRLDVTSFDLTVSTDPAFRYYTNSSIQKFILKRLTVEGSITFPWGGAHLDTGNTYSRVDYYDGDSSTVPAGNRAIADFISGRVLHLCVYWNGGGSTNLVSFDEANGTVEIVRTTDSDETNAMAIFMTIRLTSPTFTGEDEYLCNAGFYGVMGLKYNTGTVDTSTDDSVTENGSLDWQDIAFPGDIVELYPTSSLEGRQLVRKWSVPVASDVINVLTQSGAIHTDFQSKSGISYTLYQSPVAFFVANNYDFGITNTYLG